MSNNECSIARIRVYFEHERHILIVMLCTIRLMSFYCGNELLTRGFVSMGKKKKTTPLKHNGEKGYDTRNFGVFPIEKGKKVWIFGILISHVIGKAQEYMLAIQLRSWRNIERNIKILIQIQYWGVESQLDELGSKPSLLISSRKRFQIPPF